MQEKWNEKLQPIILWLNTQRHLQAIKMSLVHLIPFLIGVSVIAIIQSTIELDKLPNIALTVYRFLPLLLAYDIGSYLSAQAKVNGVAGGMICVANCVICQGEILPSDPTSMYFAWMLCSVVSGEIYCQSSRLKFNISGVPSAVCEYLVQLLPYIITLVVGCVFAYYSTWWMPFIQSVFITITACFDHLIFVLCIIFLTCLFWMLGLHGVASISTITRPFWMYMLVANGTAFFMNQPLPYVTGEGFYQWFVWIGGSGTTLALVCLMKCFARSNQLKTIAKQTLIGSCFNINEMVVFGTPIVMNKIMMIPFLLAPLCGGVLSYWLIQSSFISPVVFAMPWVFPAPLGAFFASGMLGNAIIVTSLVFVLSGLIYLPFLLKYDKELWKKEKV